MTVIVDYGAGNTQSVINALERIGADYALSSDIDTINNSDRLILPGVGHAAAAMQKLEKNGLTEVLRQYRKPFLGICLGMQLMFTHSEEGDTTCLGLMPGKIMRFKADAVQKVPHMGWNDFEPNLQSPLFKGISSKVAVYFVHSYYAEVTEYSIGKCFYGIDFCAAIGFHNYYGLQFHPEKSGEIGQRMILNFLQL
jgi:glutamine amidotransferase